MPRSWKFCNAMIPFFLLVYLSPVMTANTQSTAGLETGPAVSPPSGASRPTQDGDAAPTSGGDRPLDLAGVLRLALTHHPALRAQDHLVDALDAQRRQADVRPNPEIELEMGEFSGTGERRAFVGAETSLRLSQRLELGGKRDKRSRLARRTAELAEWDRRQIRYDLIRQVVADYYAVLAAQARLQQLTEDHQLAQRLEEVVAARVDAGKVSPVELLKARVPLATSRLSLEQARLALAAARRQLARHWQDEPADCARVTGDLETVSAPPSLTELTPRLAAHPALARWAAEQDLQAAELDVARAGRIPDLTISGGVQRFEETDDFSFVAAVSLPIPLFDRNRGAIEAVVHRQAQVRQQRRQAWRDLRAALAGASNRLEEAYEEVRAYRDDILHLAGQAFAAAREGYQAGKFSYLDVLDAQRTLLDARLQYLDALDRYHQAATAVEGLVGGNMPGRPEYSYTGNTLPVEGQQSE
ncbi:MAG: TolC family protein [Acidobacteria bacterium]|nr:TolC family protein [Acidobacteriota bacterium]